MEDKKQGRTAALVGYLTIVGAIIAIMMNSEPKNDLARFHIRQAFGLHIIFHASNLFISFVFGKLDALASPLFFFTWVGLYVFYFALWVYGFLGVLKFKKQAVPVLGVYFQKWFTFIS